MSYSRCFLGGSRILQANFRGRIPSFAAQALRHPLSLHPPAPHVLSAMRAHAPGLPGISSLSIAVQRWSAPAPEVVVQRSGPGFVVKVPDHLDLAGRGPGRPLPPEVRDRVESFFRADFSGVRIHVGPQAEAIGAFAYTVGSEIFFAPGQYEPHRPHGLRILGHELTHVVQQRAGRVRNPFGGGLAVVQDVGLEAEAERMGVTLTGSLMRTSVTVQRQISPTPVACLDGLRGGGFVIQPLYAILKGTDTLLNLKKDENDNSNTVYLDTSNNKKYKLTGETVNSNSRKKPYKVVVAADDKVEEVDEEEVDSDASSEGWEKESLGSDEEKKTFTKKSKQPELYKKQRHEWDKKNLKFNSSEGLSEAVKMVAFGGKGQYAANTHVIYVDRNGGRYMIQSSTANAMKAMAKRFHAEIPYEAVSNKFKGKHIHAEMYLLYQLTGGDAGKIDNVLDGYKLYVDKPVCKKCYPFVKRAKPRKIKDGTDFYGDPNNAGRGDFPDWQDPFKLKL